MTNRPGTIVGAGRLWPEERIEPRIARMGTDKKSRSWSWSSSVISVLSVVKGLFIRAAESASARRDAVPRMFINGTRPHFVPHSFLAKNIAYSLHFRAIYGDSRGLAAKYFCRFFLHLPASAVKYTAFEGCARDRARGPWRGSMIFPFRRAVVMRSARLHRNDAQASSSLSLCAIN